MPFRRLPGPADKHCALAGQTMHSVLICENEDNIIITAPTGFYTYNPYYSFIPIPLARVKWSQDTSHGR